MSRFCIPFAYRRNYFSRNMKEASELFSALEEVWETVWVCLGEAEGLAGVFPGAKVQQCSDVPSFFTESDGSPSAGCLVCRENGKTVRTALDEFRRSEKVNFFERAKRSSATQPPHSFFYVSLFLLSSAFLIFRQMHRSINNPNRTVNNYFKRHAEDTPIQDVYLHQRVIKLI